MYNSRALAATVVGAVIGGAAGYLFFTEHGRSLRRQLGSGIFHGDGCFARIHLGISFRVESASPT